MKTRKFKLVSLLLMALLQCIVAFGDTDSIPVDLDYDPAKKEDILHRPHKAPINIHLPLTVSYNINSNQLVFTDSQHHNYYYMVVDTNANSVSEGYLNFDNQEQIVISLDSQSTATQALFVWYGAYKFSGFF